MTYNRLAVYAHRGWASSSIVAALACSGAPLKVLYRPGSDVSTLPNSVETVQVDLQDEDAVVAALDGIDILISLVGHSGVHLQHLLISALKRSTVKLFSPSDLAARYDEQGNTAIPVNKAKAEVERAAVQAGIPITVVLPGNFAEFALNTSAMGVDIGGNRFIFTGDSAIQQLNLCTREHVAAAYASVFASTPIDQLKNRFIGLSELTPSGRDIEAALTAKHGAPTQTWTESIEDMEKVIAAQLRLSLACYCRKIWGLGKIRGMVGDDIWEVPGWNKATLEDLIVEGRIKPYRTLPTELTQAVFADTHEKNHNDQFGEKLEYGKG